jgi:hypothetical protein
MTDPKPTPEERAIHNALLALFCWADIKDDNPAESKIFKNASETVDHCIRAAVAAERERFLKWSRFRRMDPRNADDFTRGYNRGLDDMEAAIRRTPEEKP